MTATYLDFYFDPVCPFAWMTSKWVRMVATQRELAVEWRFISLRLVNAEVDYERHFPKGYESGHTAGLKLLRVAAAVRDRHGPHAVAPLYEAFGAAIFDTGPGAQAEAQRDLRAFVLPILERLDLDPVAADALEDPGFDTVVQAETDQALSLTGRDVGTPILHFTPPSGAAFFGPVISRLPTAEDAATLWDHIVGLAGYPGFAEIKRSLREVPQLRSFGIEVGQVGGEEDWRQGRRASAV